MSLLAMMRKAGLNNVHVAQHIGVTASAVGHYINGRRLMNYRHASAVRDLLASRGAECTVDQLMAGEKIVSQGTFPKAAGVAGQMVRVAINSGLLPSLADGATKCTDCDKPADRYDHRNYAEPLIVDPVCAGCNVLRGPAVFVIKRVG